jgi:putative heme-binding domain-containing protein
VADHPDPELRSALDEFIRDTGHGGHIGTFEKLAASASPAKSELAYAVLVNLANSHLAKAEQKESAEKAVDKAWAQPQSTVAILKAIGLTKAKIYAAKVNGLAKSSDPAISQAATAAAAQLGGTASAAGGKMIQDMTYETVVAAAKKDAGDAKLGKELFTRQGCIVCHTTSAEEPPKGPLLAGISKRYSRDDLCESIMKPSAKIAQGFETQWFKVKGNDTPLEGFVVHESGDELEMRAITGVSATIKKTDIERRGTRPQSIMPEGLVVQLTPHDLASILAYLESLKTN